MLLISIFKKRFKDIEFKFLKSYVSYELNIYEKSSGDKLKKTTG